MNDMEMNANKSLAGYRPEKMIIRLSPTIQIVDDKDHPIELPTANAFGVFMHEYFHYLHNISTTVGLAGFINMLEIWRLFRETIDQTGFSAGSCQLNENWRKHNGTLVNLLQNVKRISKPSLQTITTPTSVTISCANLTTAVENEGEPLLSTISCAAQVQDDCGNNENLIVEIGVQEIMEAAAWLLERRLVDAYASNVSETSTAVFPYKIVPALTEHKLPGLEEKSVLVCILAALHSSDPADALIGILEIAKSAKNQGKSVFNAVQNAAGKAVKDCESDLLVHLEEIESEFSNGNIMAIGIRTITAAARTALVFRKCDPAFEIRLVDLIAQRSISIENLMTLIPACNVLQERSGCCDQLQRDFLGSFRPECTNGTDPELGLRVVHAVFDFVGRHINDEGFSPTKDLPERPCPFYTICDLSLRHHNDSGTICKRMPWESADWCGWKQNGTCDYATAVMITRPPPTNKCD